MNLLQNESKCQSNCQNDKSHKKPIRELGHATSSENWSFDTFIPRAVFHGEVPIIHDENTSEFLNKLVRSLHGESHNYSNYNKLKHMKMLKVQNLKANCLFSNVEIFSKYVELVKSNQITRDPLLENALKIKAIRSASGVQVFTILMSAQPLGQSFTCAYNCSFCPNEPGTARSYLRDEPAVSRGYSVGWDVVLQIRSRFKTYMTTGNVSLFDKTIIKGDFVTEGGTYTSYPSEYRMEFMRDLYYGCNTIYDNFETLRPRLTLSEEMLINETVIGIRVTGLSIETRPDTVNHTLCKELRECGVTKVQIGVQTIYDNVLEKNNRQCRYSHAQKATQLLANSGFKIQIHLMPDLPGSNMEMDKAMFDYVFSDYLLIFDHLKVYPCMVLDYTEIAKWYAEKTYKPYAEDKEKLLDVCMSMTKSLINHERYDVRIERVIRDFTIDSIIGGCTALNMGGDLSFECERTGVKCICVRCREYHNVMKFKDLVKIDNTKVAEPKVAEPKVADQRELAKLSIRPRIVRDATEYFISWESADETIIYGLLRLHIPNRTADNQMIQNSNTTKFKELQHATIIRELHVYSDAKPVGKSDKEPFNFIKLLTQLYTFIMYFLTFAKFNNMSKNTQHTGVGKILVNAACKLSRDHSFNKIAVISGVGVKQYYMNVHNFYNDNLYLVKDI